MPSHFTNFGNALSFSASTEKQVSNYSAAVADGPTKSRPDATRSCPNNTRNSTVERSERNNLYDYKLQNVAPHRNDTITSFVLV